jgi:hypothetical protein
VFDCDVNRWDAELTVQPSEVFAAAVSIENLEEYVSSGVKLPVVQAGEVDRRQQGTRAFKLVPACVIARA